MLAFLAKIASWEGLDGHAGMITHGDAPVQTPQPLYVLIPNYSKQPSPMLVACRFLPVLER